MHIAWDRHRVVRCCVHAFLTQSAQIINISVAARQLDGHKSMMQGSDANLPYVGRPADMRRPLCVRKSVWCWPGPTAAIVLPASALICLGAMTGACKKSTLMVQSAI